MASSYLFVLSFSVVFFFFFKQKTAYELRISDWSSDVCSSDLKARAAGVRRRGGAFVGGVAAWAAKPQPAQEPSYRLVRCCRFGGHATFNERARPDLSAG